ncbi:hypothetical protein JKP88DRAFT_263824, partial [Tribonema minus]
MGACCSAQTTAGGGSSAALGSAHGGGGGGEGSAGREGEGEREERSLLEKVPFGQWEDELNAVLNRLRYTEVATLQQWFRDARARAAEIPAAAGAEPQRRFSLSGRGVKGGDAKAAADAKATAAAAAAAAAETNPHARAGEAAAAGERGIAPVHDRTSQETFAEAYTIIPLLHLIALLMLQQRSRQTRQSLRHRRISDRGKRSWQRRSASPCGLTVEGLKLVLPDIAKLPAEVIEGGLLPCFSSQPDVVPGVVASFTKTLSNPNYTYPCLLSAAASGATPPPAVVFRDFCRAQALCCRGSDDERRRFLMDLFADTKATRYYGREGPCDARTADSPALSAAAFAALQRHCGLGRRQDRAQGEHCCVFMVGAPRHAVALRNGREAACVPAHAVLIAAGNGGTANIANGGARPYSTSNGAPSTSSDRGVSLAEYFNWAAHHLKGDALDAALAPVSLLPSRRQELSRVLAALMREERCRVGNSAHQVHVGQHSAPVGMYSRVVYSQVMYSDSLSYLLMTLLMTGRYRVGDTVYLVAMGWWREWARYTGLSSAQQRSQLGGAMCKALGLARAQEASSGDRPHEVSNETLCGAEDWAVKEGVREGVDFVTVPKDVWAMLSEWYGGGVAFGRKWVCRYELKVWAMLSEWYGGGVAFGRKVAAGQTDLGSLAAVRYCEGARLDLQLLGFKVAACSADPLRWCLRHLIVASPFDVVTSTDGQPGEATKLVLTSRDATLGDLLETCAAVLRTPAPAPAPAATAAAAAIAAAAAAAATAAATNGETAAEESNGGDDGGSGGPGSDGGGDAEAVAAARSRVWVLEETEEVVGPNIAPLAFPALTPLYYVALTLLVTLTLALRLEPQTGETDEVMGAKTAPSQPPAPAATVSSKAQPIGLSSSAQHIGAAATPTANGALGAEKAAAASVGANVAGGDIPSASARRFGVNSTQDFRDFQVADLVDFMDSLGTWRAGVVVAVDSTQHGSAV